MKICALGKHVAQRIEEETGTAPDDMTDEELDQAMSDQIIQGEELERLSELKDAGIITEEEFALKKKQLLGL